MPQPQRRARHKKIEPLSWEVAAQSPALKGMTSFLDIPAEDIRAGKYVGALALDKSRTDSSPDNASSPGDEAFENQRHPGTLKLPKVRTMPTQYRASIDGLSHISEAASFPSSRSTPATKPMSAHVNLLGEFESRSCVALAGDERGPGYENIPDPKTVSPGTPGRGRSKVRRCVLAQDGHSLGEEAIYQVMWRGGRPESQDLNASRTIRIGAADIGFKVNMAKKNVRQNVSRLFDKLALEILEDFETMSSQPRLYRIFSYKQILERRRAVGMEFVLRNKGVVFCTANGEELVPSAAYVSTPGDETSIRPAPPKKRRKPLPPPTISVMRAISPPLHAAGEADAADIKMIVETLNRYWPVDQAAAEQLLRDCRRVRADARVEEIAFFVGEKLELARNNRSITNPTGLVLATVPKSFVGTSFESFRERMERQAALVEEEKARLEREQEQLRKWLSAERGKNEAIVNDPSNTQHDRDAAEKKLRQYATWNP